MTVKELKKGEFFTKKPITNPNYNQVFVRGEYDRSSKKYECCRFSDMNNTTFLKGDTEIYTDFVF